MGVGSVFLNGKNIDLKTSGFLANESNTTRVFGSSGFIKTQKIISSPNINTNYGGLGLMLHNPGITLAHQPYKEVTLRKQVLPTEAFYDIII